MLKTASKFVLALALGATPVVMLPSAAHAQTDAQQRAYQAGYQNGMNDRGQGKSLNLRTDNWHGVNLSAYQRGYEDGYRRGAGNNPYAGAYGQGPYGQDGDHDRDDRDRDHDRNNGYYGNNGYVGGPYNGQYNNNSAAQRAYQAGYQNGINDRSRNKPLNLRTDNWHGANLSAYQQGYQEGYNGSRRGHRHHDDD